MTEINEKEDLLLLDKQLCFPLYACARKIVAAYHPFLKKIGLTYTQYVTMMVIWEKKEISVHDLGERLYLDSGTLTPVLKKLESFGYIAPPQHRRRARRHRHPDRERPGPQRTGPPGPRADGLPPRQPGRDLQPGRNHRTERRTLQDSQRSQVTFHDKNPAEPRCLATPRSTGILLYLERFTRCRVISTRCCRCRSR